MTSYELIVPIKLRELIDNFKPSSIQVDTLHANALEISEGKAELLTRGMAWANAKLLVEVEILKELLAYEISKNFPKIRRPGRPSIKPRGIKTGRFTKKPTSGAPVQHNLGGSTKAHALDAYEKFYPKSEQSAKKTARSYLQACGVDIYSKQGQKLEENLRKRINEIHLQLTGKRQRKWNGLKP